MQNVNSLKAALQQFFSDDLVVIAGSGLSAAEGMPTMGDLERHLNDEVPRFAAGSDLACWNTIAADLAEAKGLEAALLSTPPTDALEEIILRLTGALIETAERTILEDVITGKRVLPFSRLLPHLNPQPNRALPVVTTNYDRLIEVAAEMIGWGVDSMFLGETVGTLNPPLCRRSFIKDVQVKSKRITFSYRNRIIISKPHGSLDWFQHPDGPLRCQMNLSLPRLIITPGRNKYHRGYAIPFDKHRETGNSAIDKAARLLILGYGFNDDHLETHLNPSLKQGKPSLILCRTLSDNAATAISSSPNAMAISHNPKNANGFLFTTHANQVAFDFAPIWQVSAFIDNILTP